MANKGKDIPRDLTDRALGRALGRKIARLERHVRELETASQAAHRSVEDGAIDWYDDNDVLRERIGKQADGSFGRLTVDGPVPPVPTEPDVVVIDNGVVAITWDGRCEEKWPFAEFRAVRVHMDDTEDFTPDRDNQVGAIRSHRGETIVAVTESDDDNPIWVRLVAVSTAGHTSDPSAAVLVDELDEDDLDEEGEEQLEWEDGDGHTLTLEDINAGTVTFGLSFIPEEESLLGWWHPGGPDYAGVPQTRGVTFTVDYEAATVTWTLQPGVEAVGDRLRVYYPHYSAGSLTTIVDWQSPGWSYLQVASGDTTDRSGVAFDDSSWSVAAAAFAKSTASAHPYGYPAASNLWAVGTRLWVRRDLDVPADATTVTISIRVDDTADVYWNGVLIGSCTSVMGADTLFEFNPATWSETGNVLAVRGTDSPAGPPSSPENWTYLDASVTAMRGLA